jgi:death-on-curing protein
MHTVLIQRYGGLPGVRDPGTLEAALYRPQTGYYKDTIEQAAALMESELKLLAAASVTPVWAIS